MTPEQQAETDAFVACYERSKQLFPLLAAEDDEALNAKAASPEESDWRVGKDGHFVWEAKSADPKRRSPFLFTCAGNVRQRVIELIEFDGETKRPEPGQVWSF